jgi:hypothetical protein
MGDCPNFCQIDAVGKRCLGERAGRGFIGIVSSHRYLRCRMRRARMRRADAVPGPVMLMSNGREAGSMMQHGRGYPIRRPKQ